jgi:hypothetical protein
MKEDKKWQSLLGLSAPTFVADTAPYGFTTRTLAGLQAQRRDQEQIEKIGLRALWASLAALVVVVGVTFSLQFADHRDAEPGLRSFLQIENVQIS